MDWATFFTSVVTSGLTATIVGPYIGYRLDLNRQQRTQREIGTQLAVRLAVMLEKFASDCSDVINDNVLFDSSGGHAGTQHGAVPPLPEFPATADWQSLDARLASRLWALPLECHASNRAIQVTAEVEDHEEAFDRLDHEAGRCGYRAWQLAADLRKAYALPAMNLKEFSWDFVLELKDQHDKSMAELNLAHQVQAAYRANKKKAK